MKKIVLLLFAALLLVPTVNAQVSRKKKTVTDIAREGNNKRLWLRSKADTNWRPTPGGLYEQVNDPAANAKKGKKADPIIVSGKQKVRESAYDTVWKFSSFNNKTFYYVNYDYNEFRPLKWMKDEDRQYGNFDPVMDYVSSAGRIPMHICAVYAINPSVTDPDERNALAESAQMEAVISLDYLRDIILEREMKNKISYKVAEVDYRYWKGEEYSYMEKPTDELIRLGLIVDFTSKKIDLFPSAAAGAKTYADMKFFPNDATIQPTYNATLDDLAEYLAAHDNLEVLLTGYSDNVGTEAYNRGLARQRAVEVRKALIKRGVPDFRIELVVKGEDDPIGDNNTYAGRLENNRVSIVLQ